MAIRSNPNRGIVCPFPAVNRLLLMLALLVGTVFYAQGVTVAWNRNPESNIAGYNLYYGELNTAATRINAGSQTSVQVSTLSPGKTYYFYATAYNTAGLESVPSPTVTYTQPALGPAPEVQFVGADDLTKGNWKGVYGLDGYSVIRDQATLPTWAQVSSVAKDWVWTSSTNDPVVLQQAASTNRIASCLVSADQFVVNVNFTDGLSHKVSFYCLDYMTVNRRAERIEVLNAYTDQVLHTIDVASFSEGRYLSWNVKGAVKFRFTRTGQYNAVISGIFIDPPASSTAPTVNFVGADVTTKGNWKGVYGSQGYDIIRDRSSLPTWADVSTALDQDWLWASSTADPVVLQKALSTDRIAACLFSPEQFVVNVNLTDGQTHKVTFYCLDYMGGNTRTERIEAIDPKTGKVLHSLDLATFGQGRYLSWNVKGSINFRFTRTGSYNAVVSGIFIDAPSVPTVQFAGVDTATRGNWKGVYGLQGYNIIEHQANLPPTAQVTSSVDTTWVWDDSTTDPVVLQKTVGTDRIAACLVSANQFDVNVGFTDGLTHKVSFYCLDYMGGNDRAERIDVINPTTGQVLHSTSISSFGQGRYLSWNVKGAVKFRFTRTGAYNAVVSGVFIDPPTLLL